MKFLFYWKVEVKGMSPLKISNRYAEYMQNLFVSLIVPSNYYGKLTQLVRGSESQELFLLSPWRTGASLDLVSHQKQIFLNTMKYSICRLLMVWVIIPNILLSCPTKMLNFSTDTHKYSGTTSRSTSINIRLSIKHQTQSYKRWRKKWGQKVSSVQKNVRPRKGYNSRKGVGQQH